jgi:excinuclease ABC subunit A
MIRAADHCLDMGPGAGVHGGRVMAQGTPADIEANPNSLTGRYMSGALQIAVPKTRRSWLLQQPTIPQAAPSKNVFGAMPVAPTSNSAKQSLTILGARGNNLQHVDAEFPVGLLTCVTGVSGSGKSTLVNDTLYAAAARQIHRAHEEPAAHDDILGLYNFDKVINVDQSPIGRTPRSNPATYTGLFTPLRELMARARGVFPSMWKGGVAPPAKATAW